MFIIRGIHPVNFVLVKITRKLNLRKLQRLHVVGYMKLLCQVLAVLVKYGTMHFSPLLFSDLTISNKVSTV